MSRIDGRQANQLRKIHVTPDFMPNSDGSCLIEWGNTRILVTANASMGVPPFLDADKSGWLTAEYAMLPGSTQHRKQRERTKTDSRSVEIQRLIGRSLRSVLDFSAFAGITINIDADVIQADGGTRTASITGGFIALSLLFQKLLSEGKIQKNPIRCFLAATSCGIVEGEARLDLCYQEDSRAEADMNFVGTEDGNICELQISGEKRPVTDAELAVLIALCKQGITQLIEMEKAILQGEHTYER